MNLPTYSTLSLSLDQGIAEIRLNRPDKSNAMNDAMWQEIRQAADWVDATPEARVAILSGEGRNFCAGIDLAMLGGIQQRIAHPDGARSREALRRLILDLRASLPDADALLTHVRAIAAQIAAKSPLAIRGSKEMLNYSRDHSLADSLNYVATWNAGQLLSADLREAMTAARERRAGRFGD